MAVRPLPRGIGTKRLCDLEIEGDDVFCEIINGFKLDDARCVEIFRMHGIGMDAGIEFVSLRSLRFRDGGRAERESVDAHVPLLVGGSRVRHAVGIDDGILRPFE